MTAFVAVLSVILAGAFFVRLTSPAPADQVTAPSVSLSAGEVTAAQAVPLWSGAIPVINFHDVSNSRGAHSVPPSRFARQLAALKAGGFSSVGLKEVRQLVMHQPVALPVKPVLITFDNGVATQYEMADAILAKYGFRAVSFLPTRSIMDTTAKSRYYLSWQQVEAMQASGRWEFGSHTHQGNHDVMTGPQTHGPWLTNAIVNAAGAKENLQSWEQRISADLDTSIEELVRHTGRPPEALAYPFTSSTPPSADAHIQEALRRLVAQRFPLAFISSVKPPEAVDAMTDPTSLPRFEMSSAVEVADLLAAITRMVPVGNGQGPLSAWRLSGSGGLCRAVGANTIQFVADSTPAGGKVADSQYVLCRAVINSRQWRNYTLIATIPRLRSSTVLLAVRDGVASRAELAVGRREAVLRQQVGGRWHVLRRVTFPPLSRPTQWQVTVSHNAVEARCLGRPILLAGDLRPSVTWGAPAFGFIGKGTLTLSGITVQPIAAP